MRLTPFASVEWIAGIIRYAKPIFGSSFRAILSCSLSSKDTFCEQHHEHASSSIALHFFRLAFHLMDFLNQSS